MRRIGDITLSPHGMTTLATGSCVVCLAINQKFHPYEELSQWVCPPSCGTRPNRDTAPLRSNPGQQVTVTVTGVSRQSLHNDELRKNCSIY